MHFVASPAARYAPQRMVSESSQIVQPCDIELSVLDGLVLECMKV